MFTTSFQTPFWHCFHHQRYKIETNSRNPLYCVWKRRALRKPTPSLRERESAATRKGQSKERRGRKMQAVTSPCAPMTCDWFYTFFCHLDFGFAAGNPRLIPRQTGESKRYPALVSETSHRASTLRITA